jgi:spore coat protein JC
MWIYEKKLQYPVRIKNPNPKLASLIISQIGGPDGEIGASMRYLHQRYACPYDKITGILTDVGTEELGHIEMVSAIIHQLTRNLTHEQIENSPFAAYFIDHTTGVYPVAASGVPFDMKYVGVKGDILTDLNEDLAAEQKARTTYDNILRLTDDPDVRDPIKFLREREIVHYQRFGEGLRIAQDNLNSKNFYACNPSFDKGCGKMKNC